jgi:hypothetical protein
VIPPEAAAITSPAALAEALLRSVGERGRLTDLLGRVNRVTELLRDRLTADMYAAFTSALRLLREDLGLLAGGRAVVPAPMMQTGGTQTGATQTGGTQAGGTPTGEAKTGERTLDHLSHAMIGILRLSATVAGLAAENMVRGGGRLFLDLGRRIERAQSVAVEIAQALEQPAGPVQPGRIEAALRLVLELCDSVITYRSRYMSVLQPGPALDLVLADEGNPRGLAFQLAAIRDLLLDIEGLANGPLAASAEQLLADAALLAADVVAAAVPGEAVAALPARLRSIEAGVAALSDRLTRRYFVLLPPTQTLGLEDAVPELHGVA